MSFVDSVFWWTGAGVAVAACITILSIAIFVAALFVKMACNAWWERALTAYRIESVRHYMQIMIKNGRTGLLKEVSKSAQEKKDITQ